MANVNIKVGYTVDKTSLNEIKRQLTDIRLEAAQAKLSGRLTEDLKEASKAADQLEDILNSAWNSKLNQLDLSKVNNGIKNTYGNVQNLQQALVKSGNAGATAYNNFAMQVLNTNVQLKQTSSTLDKMATTFKNTIRYGISSSIFNNLTSTIQKAYDYTIKLDTSLNDIRIVTGKSADEMDKFAIRANKVAKDLGRSTRDFTEASLIYYQQGLGDEEAQARAEVTMKAANVTGQAGREVSEQLTAVWNGYKVTADEAELYVDKLAAVAAGTAADLEELSTGMGKVASAANLMGVDIDQLNAQLATIVSVTRQAPESVGVALKTIYSRMSDIQSGLDDETTLGRYTEKMAQYGINVLDANNNLRDMGDVIEEIGNKWTFLSREQQVALSQTMAGQRQYNNLLSLFDNWDMYTNALEMSSNAVGTLQEQQDIYMESTEAHLQKLSTEAEKTYDILFDQDSVNDMSDAMTGLLSIFNDLLAGLGGGLKDFAFFGSTIANIFNKQIGSSIERQIENLEAMRANVSREELQKQIIAQGGVKGEGVTNASAIEKEIPYAEKTLELQKYLTEEQAKQFTNETAKIGLLEQQIQGILQYKDIAEKYGVEIKETAADTQKALEDEIEKQSELQTKETLRYKNLKNGINDYVEGTEHAFETEEQQLQVQIELIDAMEGMTLNKEKMAQLSEITEKVAEGEKLTEKEIQFILENQKNIRNDINNKVNDLRIAAKGAADEEAGILVDLQNEQTLREKNLQTMQTQVQRQKAISEVVRGTTAVISLLTAASGILKTINDETLSAEEKQKRVFTTLLTNLPLLIMNLSSIAKLLPNIAIVTNHIAILMGAQGVTAASSFAASLWGIISVAGPYVLAIGAVIAVIYSLVKAYNADADAAKEAIERAKELQKEYKKLTEQYKEFKSTLEDYSKAKASLNELDKATEEYGETLEKTNEYAEKLLENNRELQAIAHRDASGVITFDEEGLKNYEKLQKRRLSTSQAVGYQSQYGANQLQMTSNITDALRKINFKLDQSVISELQSIYSRNGSLIDNDIDNLTTASDELKESIKKDIESSNSQIINLIKSNDSLAKANTYLAAQITRNYLEENNEDYQKRDVDEKAAIDQMLAKTSEALGSQYQALYQSYVSDYKNVKAYGSKQWTEGIARQYAQERGLTLTKVDVSLGRELLNVFRGSNAKGEASFTNAEGNIEKADLNDMIDWLATKKASNIINKANEFKYYKGAANLTDALKIAGDELNVEFNSDTLRKDILEFAADINKTIDNITQLSPEEVEKLKTQMDSVIKSLAGYNWNGTGYKNATDFVNGFKTAIDEQYDALKYYIYEKDEGIKNATQIQNILSPLSQGNPEELKDEQKEFLTELERKYEELGEIQDKTSHEYLSVLREIKEQEETNAVVALENIKKIKQEDLDSQLKELEEYEEKWNTLTEEQKESKSGENYELYLNIVGKTEEIENTIKDLENADYEIQMKIKADLASDVSDAFNIADEMEQLRNAIHDDLTYTFEEAQALIDKGYGEMFTRAKETAENTIQVNKDVLNAFVDNKQEEIEVDRQAKINQLEQQKVLLQSQKDILINKLSALKEAATAETDVDAATAMEKVANSENEYKAAIEALNAELKDEAEGATESQNINAELFNALGDMYDKDSINEQQAEADATNNQAENIKTRINNVRSLHQAYSSLATQIRASENGENTPFFAGNVNGGSLTGITGSESITANTQQANQIDIQSLTEKTKDLFKNNKSQYSATINALIKNTQAQINSVEAQIGAADAGIAALKSASLGLDNAQIGAGTGKGGNGGGGKSSKEPNRMDAIDKEINRYHDVDIQLKQIETDIDKLNSQKEKLFGKDLIENLNKQLSLLNKQIAVTSNKVDIAKTEASELQKVLSEKGVAFGEDGTIANYTQAYVAQLNYVNGLIAQYNNMSAEAQESFKDTVEQAKNDFDTFVKNIDRYDEVVTDLIPGLEKDVQSAIDEKIDLQIEKFDMEIEIRLNLAEAERDWNDFKKKIIDEVEDDNILGNAMAKLVDFSSYYKEDNTGVVQALRKQVDNTLAELNQMDTNGWSNVYGDNRAAALEDLKKYYEELMTNLEDVLDLQKEIHESYIDMMDEAQDKFDEQIKSYEMISDLIDHDMKVISLIYGEESYSQLARYYDKQQQNFNSQLDFQRQQVDFWRAQLDALDEGSDAWENAKEKWADAVGELNTLIENSIENLQNKYLNTINSIFQNLNNKVTDGLGLDYIDEEWTLINKNAEQYLDTINSLYEVQKLESKYLDALDNTDSISAQRQIKEIMDEELADLRERDKLTQYDIERANKKYEIALKQIALQEAQQNKTKMRLRRDSQGNYRYEYTTDGDQVGQLQSELNDMYNSLYNFDKSKYQDNLNQMYSVWVEFQEKMAEAAQINDPVARSERELLLQNQYEQLINGLTEQNATVRENLHESAFDDLSRLYDIDVSNFQNMSDQEKEVLMGDLIPYWESGVQHMTEVFAGEDGFLGVCRDAFDQLHDATKDYEDGLDELENAGRIDFESIGEGIDQNIERTQQLITDNNELINSYEQELSAINNVIGELDNLVDKYNAAKDAAIAATKAAYEYWSEQQRQTANAAGKENSSSGSGSDNQNSNSSSNSKGGSNGGTGGDGNLVIGDTATFNGQYYYDSYGTSPAGSKYSGVTNGIVVDRIIGNPYGIHIHSADGKYKDLGWIRKSQLSGYDTGGYTGTWGNDGRLALLHQKELVLNKEDTANMLNAVNIIRNITGLLGNSILGKMAAATAGNFGANIGNDVLEQNVHIDAQFPNVKDSREIEDALNNLVNMASMRANKNNR